MIDDLMPIVLPSASNIANAMLAQLFFGCKNLQRYYKECLLCPALLGMLSY